MRTAPRWNGSEKIRSLFRSLAHSLTASITQPLGNSSDTGESKKDGFLSMMSGREETGKKGWNVWRWMSEREAEGQEDWTLDIEHLQISLRQGKLNVKKAKCTIDSDKGLLQMWTEKDLKKQLNLIISLGFGEHIIWLTLRIDEQLNKLLLNLKGLNHGWVQFSVF